MMKFKYKPELTLLDADPNKPEPKAVSGDVVVKDRFPSTKDSSSGMQMKTKQVSCIDLQIGDPVGVHFPMKCILDQQQ